ncbi:hypothetical protein T439DRAFT_334447 [Meredithblackwellia eburnea MCA 4105]
MGLFGGKKKEVIPEVAQPSYSGGGGGGGGSGSAYGNKANSVVSSAPSYRTNNSYVPPSQGGAGYGPPPGQRQPQYGAPPQQHGGYSRGAPPPQSGAYGGNSNARSQLLSGAPPQRGPSPGGDRYGSGTGGAYSGNQDAGQDQAQQNEDEEVEGIKQQMRFVKQESLASTRNAVRIAREAEETARATLDKLRDQSDRFANTENYLDMAKAHNSRAQDETKELEALNRSIFRPNMTWNKQAKRDKEEARIMARHAEEKAAREETRRVQYESHQRIQQTYVVKTSRPFVFALKLILSTQIRFTAKQGMDRAADNARLQGGQGKAKGAERSRYQFEATESDDEVENEIDGNLDELSGISGRLKTLALAAGQQLEDQNKVLVGIAGKVDRLDAGLVKSTMRLNKV